MNFLMKLFDILIPRFLTEDVALEIVDGRYEIVCSMTDIAEGERFDGVTTIRCLNIFGSGLFPTQAGDVRPWPTR